MRFSYSQKFLNVTLREVFSLKKVFSCFFVHWLRWRCLQFNTSVNSAWNNGPSPVNDYTKTVYSRVIIYAPDIITIPKLVTVFNDKWLPSKNLSHSKSELISCLLLSKSRTCSSHLGLTLTSEYNKIEWMVDVNP